MRRHGINIRNLPLLREKILSLALVLVAFAVLYGGTQRISLRPITWLEMEPDLNRHVPFTVESVWVYLSLYPLLALGALGVPTLSLLKRYTLGLVGLAFVSSFFFLFLPTGLVRPPAADPPWVYRLVTLLDEPKNAFPSLHASLSIVAAVFCQHHFANGKMGWSIKLALWLWVAAIFWSCLALRQHTGIDLLGGAILGIPAAWLALSHQRSPNPLPPLTQDHPSTHSSR